MRTTPTAEHEVPRPSKAPSFPIARLDLEEEIRQMRASPKTNGHLGKTLLRATDMRLVLMLVDRGVRISEHLAQGSLTIHTIQGHVTVTLLDSSFDLTAGQLLTIEPGVSHAMTALLDSAVLLTIAWNPNKPILRASDLMERDVITVTPSTRVLDIHRLFVEEEIHGAPVVGEDGLVQGVVSTIDLLRAVRDELEPGAGSTATTYFRDELPYSGPDWMRMPEDLQDRMQEITAADVMTRELVMVGPDATVDEIARAMSEHRVHRVLVGEDGVLQGVITTFDLLRVFARVTPVLTGPARYTGYRRADVKTKHPA